MHGLKPADLHYIFAKTVLFNFVEIKELVDLNEAKTTEQVKKKCEFVPVVAMKACRRSRGVSVFILDFVTRWR